VYRASDPVDESLRGWHWYEKPLRPRAFLELSMADAVYRFCPSRRDLWLRRRVGVEGEASDGMKKGFAIHSIFHISSSVVAKAIFSGYSPWDAYEYGYRQCIKSAKMYSNIVNVEKLCKEFSFIWSSMAMELGLPIAITEFTVDGSLIGLSRNLRVDALFEGSVIIELKYGSFRRDYIDALAGYAIAMESFIEMPIDFGILMLVNSDGTAIKIEPVYIGNDVRREFIELRDEAIDILLSDIEPPKASSCPSTCPYKRYCG